MSQLVASDDANPNFIGAHNPDAKLTVQFYSRPVQNMFKTEAAGRPIYEDLDYVKIFTPGNQLNEIDTPARDDHKVRFPLHWARYQNNRSGESGLIGTPINQWALVSAAQAEELKYLKFFTVESVANSSDLQLQSLGMVAGMGGHAFRERAQNFLRGANAEALTHHQETKLKEAHEENERLRLKMEQDKAEANERFDAMQRQIEAMASRGTSEVVSSMKPKRGRPAKVQEASPVGQPFEQEAEAIQ